MICQPSDVLAPLELPPGVRVIGINSVVKHSIGGSAYRQTRCAAFMGHRMILDSMRNIGAAMKRELTGDPMNGYLANLDPDDYKRLFREALPESMKGHEFLDRFDETIDTATNVEPDLDYLVRHAVDHHVLEARRVKRFVEFLEQAAASPAQSREHGMALDRAGHLMYASHVSYTNDAMLGAPECDLLVDLVRRHERAGLYGARITAGGSGGTVAVLCDSGERADPAVAAILADYEGRMGKRSEVFSGTSPGAWHTGTITV
jgi:L-arabinokinase